MVDNISRLVTTASKLVSGGLTTAEGTLVRKVCGPILARYSALCVSRWFAGADIQRDFIRSQAQYVFCSNFVSLLYDCHLREERELIDPLSVYILTEALYSSEAEALVNGRVAGANRSPKVLRLGRVLVTQTNYSLLKIKEERCRLNKLVRDFAIFQRPA